MGTFFMFLIGWIVCLGIMAKDVHKKEKIDKSYINDRYQTANDFNKIVYQGKYINGKPSYYETKTNRQVFKGKNKFGLERWFYADDNTALLYPEDNKIKTSFMNNAIIAKANNKKWFVIENFWDDSIYNLDGRSEAPSTYLDDFRYICNFIYGSKWNDYARKWNINYPDKIPKKSIDMNSYHGRFTYGYANPEIKKLYERYFYVNNPVNQKVYLKNMRPYQLYLLGKSENGNEYCPIKIKQYLIRFGNTDYFNYKSQKCITDKQISGFWSKWYAITEKEYLDLTMTVDDIERGIMIDRDLNTVSKINYYLKPISETDIAFVFNNTKKINWSKPNCSIIRAFDNNGNFVGEYI